MKSAGWVRAEEPRCRVARPDADNETETPVADTEEAEADLLLEVDQDEKLDPTFYDRIAEALRDVDRIVLLSHGTGSSNASNILTERLKKHDLGIYAKIISQAEVDTSAMTKRKS